MKFLDDNIFIYAYYKPKKTLTEKEESMKDEAKKSLKTFQKAKRTLSQPLYIFQRSLTF